jgi:hypothetical protein
MTDVVKGMFNVTALGENTDIVPDTIPTHAPAQAIDILLALGVLLINNFDYGIACYHHQDNKKN